MWLRIHWSNRDSGEVNKHNRNTEREFLVLILCPLVCPPQGIMRDVGPIKRALLSEISCLVVKTTWLNTICFAGSLRLTCQRLGPPLTVLHSDSIEIRLAVDPFYRMFPVFNPRPLLASARFYRQIPTPKSSFDLFFFFFFLFIKIF